MTHPANTQAENHNDQTPALLSDVAAQMQRIENARKRIQASSNAIITGAFLPTVSEEACASPSNDPSKQRIEGMGRAMDQVLNNMQNQVLADIGRVMQQQAGLRKFQQEIARSQNARGSVVSHEQAPEFGMDDVIDVEAKPVPEQSSADASAQPPGQY